MTPGGRSAQRASVAVDARAVEPPAQRERRRYVHRIEAHGRVFVLADAVGWHLEGFRVAERAAEAFAARLVPLPIEDVIIERLTEALQLADDAVVQEPVGPRDASARAVSLAALVFLPNDVIALNVGNTRSYWMGSSGAGRLNRVHALTATSSEADPIPPQPIRPRQAVERALGLGGPARPHVCRRVHRPGDRFLLSTWSLWSAAGDDALCACVAEARDPEHAARRLREEMAPGTPGALVLAEVGAASVPEG